MQPRVADTVKPQLPDVVEAHKKLPAVYHSPITMIGWCIYLLNFAGVVPVMLVSAYITYGFYVKRDFGSAVALNMVSGLLLVALKEQEQLSTLARDGSTMILLLLGLVLLFVSCTTEMLRIRSGLFALWLRAIVLLVGAGLVLAP